MKIMESKKRVWVFDLETLDVFTATFLDRDSDETRVFVIDNELDDKEQMFEFLDNEVAGLIGFNSINFDAQVLEYMYRNPDCTPGDIRRYAQIITSDNDRMNDIPEYRLRHKHLDLYRIHHFDNKNKRTGLKWCEFSMDLENIEDMPSDGEGSKWLEMILSYNLNDVIATKELYKRTIDMIELRKQLTTMYGISLINASDSKIGSELTLKLYCKKTGKNIKDVRSMRTYRKSIKFSEIIFPYINFKSVEFNMLLNHFKKVEIKDTKSDSNFSVNYKGFQFDYGNGGIHGSISNSIVESDKDYIIIDADVSSLYPSIAIVNGLYPRHLGKEFPKIYNDEIVLPRLEAKKAGNKVLADGFKLAANSVYGKSNDIYSWLYDPQYTMATTINGQLLLTMLAEMLMEIENSTLIQINTDGLTMRIPRDSGTQYFDICEQWMKLTNLQLEYVKYSKMIIFDVNNYLAFYIDGKYKAKGRCEFENIPLHKNKSFAIIPRAFYEYHKNNIEPVDFITNHKNIFDFCAGVKSKKSDKKGGNWYQLHWIEDGEYKTKKLSKTVRYYISNKGATLIKHSEDGSQSQVEAPVRKGNRMIKDWKVTYFNKSVIYDDFTKYDIDYTYYISKVREWINDIKDTNQLSLF
jgi:hypothetical protein